MAGPTFGGVGAGGGSGPSFGGTAKKTKKKGGKSWFGGLKNAVGDVENAAVGTVVGTGVGAYHFGQDFLDLTGGLSTGGTGKPRGSAQPFKRTTDTAKAIGQFYGDYYGPLAKGDWKGFVDNLYEHPLQAPLDILTIAAPAAKGAVAMRLIPKAGGVALELKLANGEGYVTKTLAKGELRAQIQKATLKAKNAQVKVGPYERPQGMAATKVTQTQLARKAVNNRAQSMKFNRALGKLHGQPARAAAFLRGRFDRQALNEYTAILEAEAKNDPKGPAAASLKIINNPRVQKLFDNPTPKVQKVIDEARAVGEAQAKNLNLHPDVVEAGRFRAARIAGGAKWDKEQGMLVGGPSIDELKARGLDPVYYPDTDSVKPPTVQLGQGGGKGITQRTGAQRQNQGTLMQLGQIVMDPAALNRSFLDSVKYQHYRDTHSALLDMAQESETIPPGWEAIREVSKEHVSHVDAARGDFLKAIDSEGTFRENAPALTTKSASSAQRMANGNYLIVPSKVVKQMTGEFTRTNEFVRLMNRYPLKVWRALVLSLRPAWLVNNIVGNTMMYVIHSARPEDLRQLAAGFKSLTKSQREHNAIDAVLDKHFAGQTTGGFVAAEMPDFSPGGPLKRAAVRATRVLPDIDKAWEQMLRRDKVKAELKRHPGLKEKLERLGREVSYFQRLGEDLEGLPTNVKMAGQQLDIGHVPELRSLAEDYMRSAGLEYKPPVRYAKVDEARATKIAHAYDEMLDINDPRATPEYRRKVEQSYRAFIDETKAQYDALIADGYTFEFYPEGQDPYPLGPRQAIEDLKQNKHLYVFPSDEGFGAGGATRQNVHPLLEDTGVRWNGKEVTANDMFRAVHDVFGHGKEGVGFRWDGEENAWRAHVSMYSDKAKPAMTSETRGQNSWVNFGPHGKANRTASQADTVYAEQKAGIMPEWTQKEGAADRKYTDAEALDLVLKGDPEAVHAVYDRVNDALGNFDHLSPAERSVLRSLFPFWSWFKAISGVAGKLVIEQPLKVNLFNHLGRIVIQQNLEAMGVPRDEWPQSLLSMVDTKIDPDGRIRGLNLGPANPYLTVAQLGAFAAAVASLKPGEAGRTLPGFNPLFTDVASYVFGQTPQGYDMRGVGTAEGLPFARLLSAFEATYGVDLPWVKPAATKDPLYDHDFKDEFLRYLGVPYVRASKTAAERTVAPR